MPLVSKYRPRESLVKFDPPLELGAANEPAQSALLEGPGSANKLKQQLTRKTVVPPTESKPQLEDILHALLPPREWIEGGKHWVQYTHVEPATRLDVIQLQEALDGKLMERQARETGICPVREELYSQCFDELIRQVCVNCPERGLLLLRCRDEIRMTISAYETLYHSSVVFGTRKQLQSEQGKGEMEGLLFDLEDRKRMLYAQCVELQNQCDAIQKREQEKRQIQDRKRKEELEFLKHQGGHLESFLASVEARG